MKGNLQTGQGVGDWGGGRVAPGVVQVGSKGVRGRVLEGLDELGPESFCLVGIR